MRRLAKSTGQSIQVRSVLCQSLTEGASFFQMEERRNFIIHFVASAVSAGSRRAYLNAHSKVKPSREYEATELMNSTSSFMLNCDQLILCFGSFTSRSYLIYSLYSDPASRAESRLRFGSRSQLEECLSSEI